MTALGGGRGRFDQHSCSDKAGTVRVAGTVGRTDAAVERTGTYPPRVPAARSGPAARENGVDRSRMLRSGTTKHESARGLVGGDIDPRVPQAVGARPPRVAAAEVLGFRLGLVW